jgi:hypothetical protein
VEFIDYIYENTAANDINGLPAVGDCLRTLALDFALWKAQELIETAEFREELLMKRGKFSGDFIDKKISLVGK